MLPFSARNLAIHPIDPRVKYSSFLAIKSNQILTVVTFNLSKLGYISRVKIGLYNTLCYFGEHRSGRSGLRIGSVLNLIEVTSVTHVGEYLA